MKHVNDFLTLQLEADVRSRSWLWSPKSVHELPSLIISTPLYSVRAQTLLRNHGCSWRRQTKHFSSILIHRSVSRNGWLMSQHRSSRIQNDSFDHEKHSQWRVLDSQIQPITRPICSFEMRFVYCQVPFGISKQETGGAGTCGGQFKYQNDEQRLESVDMITVFKEMVVSWRVPYEADLLAIRMDSDSLAADWRPGC